MLDALPSVVQPLVSPERKPQAADLAYIIYTSGSTGQPKGCQVTHNNVTRLFSTSEAYYQFNHQDVWTLFHSYAFDFSVWEIWGALLYGAKLVIVPYFTSRSPVDFYQLLIDEKVTVLNQTPSAFQQLIKIDENKVDKNIASPADKLTLRWVIMGGEALDFNSIQPWFDRHGDESPQLVNMYGITETTVHVTHCPITSRLLKEQQYSNASLIGKPLPDLQVWILDAHLKAVPVGVPGEMYVGGAGVTRGYLNQPELSEERFIDVEILGKTEHVYKTGDLARWLPGANDRPENLEYLGRIDSQIKLRGFRIELGEIESLISQHPAVNDALVTLFEGESLVVYFTTDSEPNSITDELKEYIKTRLPDYMVPRLFVALDELRLTAHGKIDRKALPAPTFSLNQKAQYHAPCTQEEHALAGIWSEVLGLEKVGLLDNFFDLGGHSLLAVQLISEINHYLSADDSSLVVSIRDLFEAPTLADLALKINEAMSSSDVESRTAKITIDKPSFDLNAEVQLIPAVENHGLPPYSGDLRKPKNILLTGASGFLGAFLLRELLAKSSANIYCLVRASSNEAAQSRLVDQLKAYHTWDDAKALRIKTLCGDLSQPLFGLAQETFERLGREIDVIYHNGALVNHFYPYSVLKSPNVSGTQEVLRLAATSKLKPVHYVSTIGVLSVSSESVLSEKSLPADGNLLEGGYNQSKWVAEKILQKAQLCGVPVTVYRPAIVGGHSQSGVWNVKDFRSLMIYASLNLGCWPELDMHWNIAPVEHVSQAIVYLSSRSDSQGEVFHPVNAQDINSRQVFELLAKIGYRITPCSPEEWVSRLQATAKASQDDNLLGLSTFFERPSSSEKRTNNKNDVEMSTIDSQYSVARISEGDIRCPALDERILKNYLSFFEACGFLPNQTDINRRIINYVSSKQDAIRGKDEMLTTGDNC
ncbi:MAG: hypothetical protein COA42_21980 [Alteromonadaceae bacterium]|nr:MAG: hypothetical protein COA42_21980 [Alteromonadaceae bacterium]